MIRQLTLPTVDTRPICVGCNQPSDILGQWSPANKTYLCKECSLKYPAPMEAFEETDNSAGVGLKRDDKYDELRTMNMHMENILHRLRHGCHLTIADADPQRGLPCESFEYPADLSCKLCVSDLKRHARRILRGVPENLATIRWRTHMKENIYIKTNAHIEQFTLPFCARCGKVHNNQYDHLQGYKQHCAICEAEISAETIWRMRTIFNGRDDEDILDSIKASHPNLFDLGIMPDYWFKMKYSESEGN